LSSDPSKLDVLKGLKLQYIGNVLDMLTLGFGPLKRRISKVGPYKGQQQTVAKFRLHIQCPWRLDGPKTTITGRYDYFIYSGPGKEPKKWKNWDYNDFENSLLNKRLTTFLGNPPFWRTDWKHEKGSLIVAAVSETIFGDLKIRFTPKYTLRVFPHSTAGESWRFFEHDEHDVSPHYVFPPEKD